MTVVWLLAVVCSAVAVGFAVLGWLVDRPADSTRHARRLTALVALALSQTFYFADATSTTQRWITFVSGVFWWWLAIGQWNRLEACRTAERRRNLGGES